jgi:rhamnosyltransferase
MQVIERERSNIMRLGALVILYYPSREQLARLAPLRDACDALVVVDNTPRPDACAAAAAAAHGGYTLLHHGNRGGIAGAYNAGLARLLDTVDAVALFDQDSIVPPAYFPTMRALGARFTGRPFIAGPRILDENDGEFLPVFESSGISVRHLRLDATSEPVRCAFLISSGSVLSREAYAALGAFNEALFIDHVDTEYCFRALARNVPVYLVPSLVLRHRIGAKTWVRIGPFRIATMNHSWTRRYYSARNAMLIATQYGARFPVALLPNLLTLWQIVGIVLGERDKRAKLKGILYGVLDGLACRLGPFDTARPRPGMRAAAPTRECRE